MGDEEGIIHPSVGHCVAMNPPSDHRKDTLQGLHLKQSPLKDPPSPPVPQERWLPEQHKQKQSLRSCTGSTRGHSSWTGSSGACSSWTGSRMTHSLRMSNRACSSWTGSRMTQSLRMSSRAYSSWTGSRRTHSLKSNSRACSNHTGSSHKNHSLPWSPHRSHSPPWSPHKSHSWSRNRLAHSSTQACSSRRARSSWSHTPHSRSHSPHSRSHSPHSWSHSPHTRSHSPHSWSHSPHSWSHSLRSSHSSPWFWWIEGGAGRGAGERAVQVWSPLSLGSLYPCPGILDTITFAKAPYIHRTQEPGFGGQEGIGQPSTRRPGVTLGARPSMTSGQGSHRCRTAHRSCAPGKLKGPKQGELDPARGL
ncbi:CLK4-associating serine/arginine rich protein-like [Symphalangus syndactylus]|uniref:CLK4-associating serine/arginine rich protein-like n=1 Tax=Symphalangus syndactylus TaxID=9590 RepID=UPI0030070F07